MQTTHNGLVEIVYINGRKILNSAHTNYSYGSLERVLTHGLQKLDLSGVRNVLLLGLGGGCVVKALRKKFNFNGLIKALEIDEVIINLALHEFSLSKDTSLDVVHADAFNYIINVEEKYDLIIIDLFIDNTVPCKTFSKAFWENINKLNSRHGCFLFNASMGNVNNTLLEKPESFIKTGYHLKKFTKIEKGNTVLIGKKKSFIN